MPKLKTMKVFANPYGHLDHEGRLGGRCQLDPTHAGGQYQFIGASFHDKHTKITETFPEGDPRGTHTQDTVFAFSSEPATIPQSTYHLDAIRNGELFLVDADGAVPWLKLAKARSAAIATWKATTGEAPDMALWSEQFALDDDIAKIAEALDKSETEKAAKRDSDAKAATDKAAAEAEKTAADAKAARAKSHAAALEALGAKAAEQKPTPIEATTTPMPGEQHDGGAQ